MSESEYHLGEKVFVVQTKKDQNSQLSASLTTMIQNLMQLGSRSYKSVPQIPSPVSKYIFSIAKGTVVEISFDYAKLYSVLLDSGKIEQFLGQDLGHTFEEAEERGPQSCKVLHEISKKRNEKEIKEYEIDRVAYNKDIEELNFPGMDGTNFKIPIVKRKVKLSKWKKFTKWLKKRIFYD